MSGEEQARHIRDLREIRAEFPDAKHYTLPPAWLDALLAAVDERDELKRAATELAAEIRFAAQHGAPHLKTPLDGIPSVWPDERATCKHPGAARDHCATCGQPISVHGNSWLHVGPAISVHFAERCESEEYRREFEMPEPGEYWSCGVCGDPIRRRVNPALGSPFYEHVDARYIARQHDAVRGRDA